MSDELKWGLAFVAFMVVLVAVIALAMWYRNQEVAQCVADLVELTGMSERLAGTFCG